MAIESGYFVNGTRGYVFFLGLAEMKAAQRIAVHLLTILIFGLDFDFIRFVSYSNHW